MGTPIAYYKWLRLGDYLLSPPEFAIQSEAVEFRPTVYGDLAEPVERGQAQSYRVSVTFALQRGFYNPSETVRAYDQRKVSFAGSMLSAANDSNALGYRARGDLAFVWDDAADVSTLNGDVGAGLAASIVIDDALATISVGDYVLITNESSAWEITQVDGWNSGTKTITADTTISWTDDGSIKVARLNWHVPDCWRITPVELRSRGAGSAVNATADITVDFQGVDAPVT